MSAPLVERNWRDQRAVLVTGAETIAGIAVIRSLGRAGYRVHAVSADASALGFRSTFAFTTAVHPAVGTPAFLEWLRALVRKQGIDLIVPTEHVLVALRDGFGEFAALLPVHDDASIVYRGLSKYDAPRAMPSAVNHHVLPPTLWIDDLHNAPTTGEVAKLGAPFHVKADGVHALAGCQSVTQRAETPSEAIRQLANLRGRYAKAIVQGHVPGQGVGAFFLLHRGTVLAEFMHRRLHEVPHTGGVSSLRESWRHRAIRDDALERLRCLRWEGVAMVEYRWEPTTDRYWFIEMNGRFWGSLHLALFCGVDFPRLLADAFFGQPLAPGGSYPLRRRCRHTFPKEAQYVWSRWQDRRLPLASRLMSVLGFVGLSLHPGVRGDLLFSGDRGLYWESVKRFAGDCVTAVRSRAVSRPGQETSADLKPHVV